jgi:omega-3 fatty acid desaturase (delta-15 desaturase)
MEHKKLLYELKKSIPPNCFKSNLLISLSYMLFDLIIFSSSIYVYPLIRNYGIISHLLYWNFYGFIGWCIFVVGHDCGHGSFSKYKIINSICGHICHTILLVPYYPWARSHHMHHTYHNHKHKDRSHPWLTEKDLEEFPLIMQLLLPTIIGPIIGYWVYLFPGMKPDGSHIIWFGLLYEGASFKEKFKGFISSLSVFIWISSLYLLLGSIYELFMSYLGIICVTYIWLFIVTWFQHHDEDTIVYDNNDWTFIKGALQTVDRRIGYGIDTVHHHISDCHIVHHLFFTSIPHYHLYEATTAIYKYANDNGHKDMFKKIDHSKYPLKYINDFINYYPKINMLKWKYN